VFFCLELKISSLKYNPLCNTTLLLTSEYSPRFNPFRGQNNLKIKKFQKNFFRCFPYHNNNVNAINFFDLFELSDFYIDHVFDWLYDYQKYSSIQ
jgi:hypothetical protein